LGTRFSLADRHSIRFQGGVYETADVSVVFDQNNCSRRLAHVFFALTAGIQHRLFAAVSCAGSAIVIASA
jgi:hypothetical protein